MITKLILIYYIYINTLLLIKTGIRMEYIIIGLITGYIIGKLLRFIKY